MNKAADRRLGARGSTKDWVRLERWRIAAASLFALGLVCGPGGFAAAQGGEDGKALAETMGKRLLGEDGGGAAQGPLAPAGDWRVLSGPGLVGAMRMSSDKRAASGRYGFFAFALSGKGVFEGVYNVKPGGKAVIGVFWPDGRPNQGAAAGFMELAAGGKGGAGAINFTGGGARDGISAR